MGDHYIVIKRGGRECSRVGTAGCTKVADILPGEARLWKTGGGRKGDKDAGVAQVQGSRKTMRNGWRSERGMWKEEGKKRFCRLSWGGKKKRWSRATGKNANCFHHRRKKRRV